MKLCLFLLLSIQVAMGFDQTPEDIKNLAVKSMESQIIHLKEGSFFKAGDNQFNSLWTRDFAYSIEALLYHDKDQVVRDHLSYLLDNLSSENLVPLYADSTQPMFRVALASIRKVIPILPGLKLKSPLKVYYKVAGQYPVIDSNALVVIGACQYIEKTNDQEFLSAHKDELLKVLAYYKTKMDKDGFISQDPFSDWQDSAKRQGEIFLTQVLYWKAATMLEETLKTEVIDSEAFKEKIKTRFFNAKLGLFVIDPRSAVERRAIEDQLFAIRYKLVTDAEALKLYETLKRDPLWTTSGPGRASFPNYDKKELNWYTKFSGVGEYHGPLHWSWIWGLTGLVAMDFNDYETVKELSKRIETVLRRDRAIGEVYAPKEGFPLFKSGLYSSEKPFGWGSAYVSYFLNLKSNR